MALIILPEYLRFSSPAISLATPAYYATDLSDLRRPADQRGVDVLIPHGPVLAKPRRKTESKRSLPLNIHGDVDVDGNAIADYFDGIDQHLATLATIVDPPGTSTGTRTGELVLVTGVKTAEIHVEGLDTGRRRGAFLQAVLKLSIAAGEFA